MDVNPTLTETLPNTGAENQPSAELSKHSSQDRSPHRSSTSLVGSLQEEHSTPRFPPHRASTGTPVQHIHGSMSGNQLGNIPLEAAVGAGKGIGRIVGAGLKSPMDFTVSLARGFHNAPKLYGDESVRQADKITGFQSGLKAAGKVRLLCEYAWSTTTDITIGVWSRIL